MLFPADGGTLRGVALLVCFRLLAFVAVSLAFVVPALAQTYSFTTIAGKAYERGPVDTTGPEARLAAAQIAVDVGGNIFFADSNAHSLRQISPAGQVKTITTGFNEPVGVAIESGPLGNLYVSDASDNVIRKINAAGVVSTLAGDLRRRGYVDGIGASALFSSPRAIMLGVDGNLYVGQNGGIRGALRKVTPAGEVTTVIDALAAVPVTPDPFYPAALATDRAGNIFIADSWGHTIRKLTPSGGISIVAGTPGIEGSDDGLGPTVRFTGPVGLSFESSGNLVVADFHALRRVTPEGQVTTIAGQPHASGIVDAPGGAARFAGLGAVALDPAGNVIVADAAFGTLVRKGVPTDAPSAPILTVSPIQGTEAATYTRNVGARATVTFTSAATGAMPLSFQWLKNGAPISGGTNSVFVIASAEAGDAGAYSVRVSNAVGAITSDAVTLHVFTPTFDAFATRRAVAGGSFLWGIASGGGRLVAVGTGGKILSSIDGRNWVPRESGTTEWLVGVTYGANLFVAVGDHGTILTSTDTTTWTRAATSGTTRRLNNVVYGGGRFVAVGEAGAIVSSTDARAWTPEYSGVTTWLRGLVYVPLVPLSANFVGDNGTGRFFAAGQNGVLLENPDGRWRSSFHSPFTGPPRDIEALATGGVASVGWPLGIGQDGTLIRLTTSTIYSKASYGGSVSYSWWQAELGLAARFRGLSGGAGALFATGENGVIAAAPNITGPWSFIPSGTTANLVSGAFHGNALFIVGENETVLESETLYPGRLVNIATRGLAGPDPMISGFVVSGPVPKTMLLRAAGPALVPFGVANGLAAPILTLFDDTGHAIAVNRGWSTVANTGEIAEASARAGAFAFASGSADAALLVTLLPGAYTAQVASGTSASGVTLLEVYDAEPLSADSSRAINISTRGQVGAGSNRLIAGFVINGSSSRRLLIRAVGPTLTSFGLTGTLAEPQLQLFDGRGNSLGPNIVFQSLGIDRDEIAATSATAGAFPLLENGKDTAIIAWFVPGSYTVQVSGPNDSTGLALVEVYDLP